MKEKICVALDVDTSGEALSLVKKLAGVVGMFKVGSHLFTSEGPDIVTRIVSSGAKVFLDLKYHDIPNTVRGTARVAVRMGVSVFDIHSLGGYEMMAQTAAAVHDEASKRGLSRPKVLAITVLTSIDSSVLSNDLRVGLGVEEYVGHLAKLAKKAGLDGIVASPLEIEAVRKCCGPDFIILTPGVRPSWAAAAYDQKRVMTPKEAVERGADYIVIGRPIIAASHPASAAQKLLEELRG